MSDPAGLIISLVIVAVFVLVAFAVSRLVGMRREQRRQIALMDDSEEAVPLEAEPVREGLDYASADPEHEWDEFAGDPDHVPEHVRRPEPGEKMVELGRYGDPLRGDLLRVALLEAGIWCVATGMTDALVPTGRSRVTLHVPVGDLDRAHEVVDEADRDAKAESQHRTARE